MFLVRAVGRVWRGKTCENLLVSELKMKFLLLNINRWEKSIIDMDKVILIMNVNFYFLYIYNAITGNVPYIFSETYYSLYISSGKIIKSLSTFILELLTI